MITRSLADVPQGSSSCPRCRQVLANARSTPSSPRLSSTLPSPTASARWSPGLAICSLRPTHIQPPPRKWRCSQANTAGSV